MKSKFKILLLLLVLMSVNAVLAQNNNFSAFDNTGHDKLKEKIFTLKHSDPNLAISLCLKTLDEFMPKGPSKTTVFCYSTLGELYMKKNLPVLALSYYMDAIHESDLVGEARISNPRLKKHPWLLLNLGNIYFNEGQYNKAIEKFMEAEENFKLYDSIVQKVRGLSTTYNNIALYHIEYGEYNKALEYILKTLEIRLESNFNIADIGHSYKSLCELYYMWDMPKKAKTYQFKTDSIANYLNNNRYDPPFSEYDEISFSLSKSYVGNCLEYEAEYLELNNNHKEASEKYFEAIGYYNEFAFLKISLMNKLANSYYLNNRYAKAIDLIDETIVLSKEKNLQNEEEKALELKLKVLNSSSNYKHLGSATSDLIKKKNNRYSLQITQLLSGLESKNLIYKKQKQIEIKEREITAQKHVKSRLILFGVIAILVLGFLTVYFISRKVNVEKQFIISTQREKIANSNFEHKKRELAMMSTNIVQENELMSSILKDLKYYVSLLKTVKDQKLFIPLINNLNRALADKNKDESYSEQFSSAYPGYLEYLTRTNPDLTTADLKLCTFLRMNLNTKEIAEIMRLSVRSIESRRYRLRKKLSLSKEDDLVSFLISLKY